MGNCQSGKEEGSREELALNCCTATRNVGLIPLEFYGTLSLCSQGEQSNSEQSGEIPVLWVESNKIANFNQSHVDLFACALLGFSGVPDGTVIEFMTISHNKPMI